MEKTILHQQGVSIPNQSDLDQALKELAEANRTSVGFSVAQRIQLTEQCLLSLSTVAQEWVNLSCQAKRIPKDSSVRAEEVLAGPVSVARFLQVLLISLKTISNTGQPHLPGSPKLSTEQQWCVPVFPTSGIYDALVFAGLKAEAWLKPGVESTSLFDLSQLNSECSRSMSLTLVLGAGNVSAIPATDVLTKILQDGERVLLKMNPVNAYLKPVFEQAFQPLITAGLLRIVDGNAAAGEYLVSAPDIDRIHITGSTQTHDAIVWGSDPGERESRKAKNQPLIDVPISSELGNVSPWIVVPGAYSEKQLQFQAENIAASIVNNASFNCLATKVIITSADWSQRDRFLTMIEHQLEQVPSRYAYYPGAAERWERFTGEVPKDKEYLPWKLLRNTDPRQSPHLFREESFVCVCAETALEADTYTEFLERAVDFVNQEVWGTLCATITVSDAFQKKNRDVLDRCLSRLNYGAVGVNHWPALNYAFMSTPWGGAPGADLTNVQSGIGNVHNTFFLSDVEKTVLYGPLTLFPKPVWFPSHSNPEAVGWGLMNLYCQPSLMNLLRVGLSVVFK
ncbi:aldehyde dehydrogenase family protein [Gimesia fumaroli]|uniref:Aldehyde dehydrogenase family protein n=1 Tax=Gimesia fumaroli TaxID=2527976 RepID=A0A518I8C5_9PLAN|nr:aldehyde dehydrogenase family protein [Gimesia fumaroli]QDV49351.1 Aldehyde dehydrogenase family protein [Gimesia fumaroli]